MCLKPTATPYVRSCNTLQCRWRQNVLSSLLWMLYVWYCNPRLYKVSEHCALAHLELWLAPSPLQIVPLAWSPLSVLVRVTVWRYTCRSLYLSLFRSSKFAGFSLLFSPVKLVETPNFVGKQLGHLYGYTTILCLSSSGNRCHNTLQVSFEKV